jgi:hypothetical protein
MPKFYAPGEHDPNPDAEPLDLSTLAFDSPEHIVASLEIVNKAVLANRCTPAQAKAIASVAGTSLRALSLSVADQIAALKEQYARLEAEQRGPGRRRG